MPQIKVERIVSFNSEDPVHVAANLVGKDVTKKWKCKSAGEKTATVVLQLDQPQVITEIDVGNEHSAYIEIFVARSSSPEDYKIILSMSSLMTPLESRQSQNINKVRMFKHDDFFDTVKNEKWDRIKIVCTQPFNRNVQYGLSFVNVYSNESVVDAPKKTVGKFLLRPESPDNISIGSLFAKQKKMKEETLKGAAAIREASTAACAGSPVTKQKIKHNLPHFDSPRNKTMDTPKQRNRDELLYKNDEIDANEKIDKLVENKAKEKETEQAKKTNKEGKKNDSLKGSDSQKRKSGDNICSQPKKKQKKEKNYKPFERLLDGVCLVISGIQNPDRANLRSMALAMGAKYKPNWDDTCTHLICAFKNTPKFKEVHGKGKIVKRNWIEDGYKEKKRFPWRRYALDENDGGAESEEEIWAKKSSPSPLRDVGDQPDTDDEKETGSDVEDVIKEIQEKQCRVENSAFNADTDSEADKDSDSGEMKFKKKLKNIFDQKIFYVDDVFGEEEEKKIKQYIVAYDGLIAHGLENSTDIIVTNKINSKSVKDLYPQPTCVTPDWIWECHNKQTLAPMEGFIFE